MTNPWTKKNPMMSMWLSAANRAAGASRGQVAAQVKRSAAKANRQAVSDITSSWLSMFSPPATGRKKRR